MTSTRGFAKVPLPTLDKCHAFVKQGNFVLVDPDYCQSGHVCTESQVLDSKESEEERRETDSAADLDAASDDAQPAFGVASFNENGQIDYASKRYKGEFHGHLHFLNPGL